MHVYKYKHTVFIENPKQNKYITKSKNNFVHHCSFTEGELVNFTRKIVQLENKQIQKFGSTLNLHIHRQNAPQNTRFTVLRSPFKHKKFQDTFELSKYRFNVSISYTFSLTDNRINNYVYKQLKNLLHPFDPTSTGYSIVYNRDSLKPSIKKYMTDKINELEESHKEHMDVEEYLQQREANLHANEAAKKLYNSHGGIMDYPSLNRSFVKDLVRNIVNN